MSKAADIRGRRTVYDTRKDRSKKLRSAQGRAWLTEMFGWHGILNSSYCYEYAKLNGWYTGDPRKGANLLSELYQADLIGLDFEQHNMMTNQRSKFLTYHRIERGDKEIGEDTFLRPTGQLIHQIGTGVMTGSLHLGAMKQGATYRPGHELLATTGNTLKWRGYMMDQLCSITYPNDTWRVYGIEFERSYPDKRRATVAPGFQHKTVEYWQRKIDHIAEYIMHGHYKEHLGVDTGMLFLFGFTHPAAEEKFHALIEKTVGNCSFILTQHVKGFFNFTDFGEYPGYHPMRPQYQLYEGPWKRVGHDDFYINA
jgi:hypothetical protein